jgi:pimeloyl-ACP methyl ester carboxylesterase
MSFPPRDGHTVMTTTMQTTTHTLDTGDADIVYDVHGPLPTADGRPALTMIGQPMAASGFSTLASYLPDRTIVTYDPRGLGRSTRRDGRVDHSPTVQAEDVHKLIEAVGGPVEMFASSGGAVTALALVAAHPNDVVTLVAHEPPIIPVLPDAEAAARARAGFRGVYVEKGSSAGMAAFIAMTSWKGEFTDEYFALPAPDPAAFGMPAGEDDGSRDDPLLSDRSWAITDYRPDVAALAAAPTRIVVAVGGESMGVFTGRTAVATAELLGQQATVFPSHHGGFLGGEFGYAGQPEAFAKRLREVLAD